MKNVLLRDTDAMSMANSLEVRVPFLDNEVVDSMLKLPDRLRLPRKRLLTAAFAGSVPIEVLDRPKQGFTLPFRIWMRSEMRSDVEDRLRELPPQLGGLLDEGEAQEVWDRFSISGTRWLRPWTLYALARWTASLEALSHTTTAT
jgi:asparagine synthase (glutamine-hydrolysing)